MYVNKIDELLDKIIDDFSGFILHDKQFKKILDEVNFIKFQKEINKILMDFMMLMKDKDIYDIVQNEDSVITILNIIKRYVAYYLFLTIGLFYKGKRDAFINNMIEFTKNQPGFDFRVANFFNSENNSNLLKYFDMTTSIRELVDADSVSHAAMAKSEDKKSALKFLSNFDEDFVNQTFKLRNLAGKKDVQAHLIVKTVILMELYFKHEKKNVFDILEAAEKENGEYIFIEIVVPKTEFLDFSAIENALSMEQAEQGMAYEIYNLIIQHEDFEKSKEMSVESKILELLNNDILVPITDDFMLYHKDSEKYEKVMLGQDKKKKEDTKIKYIVSKVENVSEMYSEQVKKNPEMQKTIEKYLYAPLTDRKAVLINNVEEIKIINKMINQGRRVIENNEYYNDLLSYREYPYVNFKDLQKDGFSITPNKTIDAVRYVTIEKQIKDKANKEKHLQLRVGSKGQTIDIVGFVLPSSRGLLQCIQLKNLNDVRMTADGKDDRNGYEAIKKYFKQMVFSKEGINQNMYWSIDLEKDKVVMEKYEQLVKVNNNEHTKVMVSHLYDDLINIIYDKIVSLVDKKKEISLYEFKKIMNHFDNTVITFPKESDAFNELNNYITYNRYAKTEDKYDKKEDDFPGLFGEVIKLPSAPKILPPKFPKIKISLYDEKIKADQELEDTPESYGAICQHIYAWDTISAMRKKNPNEFQKRLFEFVARYVIVNYEDDYICKSCGSMINIKNYVLDGSHDGEGRFIVFNTPMTVPLEDIPEYEKYDSAIGNMDKMLDRLASLSNIKFLLEKNTRQKNPIKTRIIKDAIDLILVHNPIMRTVYRERTEKIKNYGLNKELSHLFVFELENNIFVFSSKDKDQYKPIKRNNILTYLLFLTLLEFNDTQIVYMSGEKIDKTCYYHLFAKYGWPLFNDIKIRKNLENVVTPIQNYKVLCYLIFQISCFITKYKMWKFEGEEEKQRKFNPVVQKIIIHTLVDLINSVLEVASKQKKDYIYEVISTKFFKKLNTTFKNNEILKKIKDLEDRKVVIDAGKRKFKVMTLKSIPLASGYQHGDYLDTAEWTKCNNVTFFAPKLMKTWPIFSKISNITNCPDGRFHDWKTKGDTMECTLCGTILDQIKLNPETSETIVQNYWYHILRLQADRFCRSGELHNFVYDTGQKCSICTKCKDKDTKELTTKELDELGMNIRKMKNSIDNSNVEHIEKIALKEDKHEKKDREAVANLKESYGKTKGHKEDYFAFINEFIDSLEDVIGKNININDKNVYLKYDSYIIDHDHNGFKLDKPIIITEKDGKVQFKRNHPFFNTDVIFYTNYKLQIEIFYDATTHLLVGFKERNKPFEFSKKQNVFIKINYSIANKMKQLGFTSKFINISDKVEELRTKYHMKDPQKIIKSVVSDLGRDRIQKLKKGMMDIQRFINRIKYNYEASINEKDSLLDSNIIEKYKNKFKKLVIKNESFKFLKGWKTIQYNLFFQQLDNKTVNLTPDAKYLTYEEVSDYDYHGNLILFFIIDQLNKLVSLNDDKFTKVNLTYLIIDIVNNIHQSFNREDELTNFDIKRFNYILNGIGYVVDLEKEGYGLEGETTGFYGEYKDADDTEDPDVEGQKDEDREERDAMDIDTMAEYGEDGIDYEIDYAAGVNMG
jgi:hypothetical protein